MRLDMRHSDIECTLRGKNSAESDIVGIVAMVDARVEQPSIRPTVRVAATKEPMKARTRKAGASTVPGLIAV